MDRTISKVCRMRGNNPIDVCNAGRWKNRAIPQLRQTSFNLIADDNRRNPAILVAPA
jgi:hypothetical protein